MRKFQVIGLCIKEETFRKRVVQRLVQLLALRGTDCFGVPNCFQIYGNLKILSFYGRAE